MLNPKFFTKESLVVVNMSKQPLFLLPARFHTKRFRPTTVIRLITVLAESSNAQMVAEILPRNPSSVASHCEVQHSSLQPLQEALKNDWNDAAPNPAPHGAMPCKPVEPVRLIAFEEHGHVHAEIRSLQPKP
jgi:hypothetical protein